MPKPETSPAVIEQIKAAPHKEPHESVAARLGVSVSTVRKYRREGREERQEAAREVIARHVEENVPDALRDLSDLRGIARAKFEETGNPQHGALWLNAIKTTLEHVKPDDSLIDADIEDELERLAHRRQVALPGTVARTNGRIVG